MNLTMIISCILVDNSLIAVEAQLDKVVADYKLLFVAVVYVSSSLDDWFAMRQEFC